MLKAEVSIHLKDKEIPEVSVKDYGNFFTVDINAKSGLVFKFFIESEQDLVNFKNNLLWAFESPEDYS